MRADLRAKHDIEARRAAIGLFERGHGFESAAKAPSVPRDTVGRWLYAYRSFGSGVLPSMDGRQTGYACEQEVAAASAVVDGGMGKRDAMEAFGAMSLAPLKRRCALCREGGAEAPRPKPRGRPRGSGPRPRGRTREQELGERRRRLETEAAYLKKLRALVGRDGLRPGRRSRRERPARGGVRAGAPAGMRRPGPVQLLLRAVAPGRADAPGAAGRGGGDLLARGRRVRPPPGRHVPARRAGRAHGRQDRAQDDAGDGARCGIRRETDCHRYGSYRGAVGETSGNVIGRDFAADGPWQKMGADATGFKQPWGKACFAPVHDFGSEEIVAWSASASPDMARQAELLDRLLAKMPEGATPALHGDMGRQHRHAAWRGRLRGAGIVQSMSRKGNCIDNGATGQVFGHMRDEFFRGRAWPDFESSKADLDACVAHWNTRRRRVKLKGLTPEEFRNQPLAA